MRSWKIKKVGFLLQQTEWAGWRAEGLKCEHVEVVQRAEKVVKRKGYRLRADSGEQEKLHNEMVLHDKSRYG